MKILFLDIDGVLNSRAWADKFGAEWPRRFDPAAVDELRRVLAETGAWIVVSSAWRVGRTHTQIREDFRDAGMDRETLARIIDKTPELRGAFPPGAYFRGAEIDVWLNKMAPAFARRLGPVESYAIVDDGDDMLEHKPRLVQTDWTTGLLAEHADRLIALLNEAAS